MFAYLEFDIKKVLKNCLKYASCEYYICISACPSKFIQSMYMYYKAYIIEYIIACCRAFPSMPFNIYEHISAYYSML